MAIQARGQVENAPHLPQDAKSLAKIKIFRKPIMNFGQKEVTQFKTIQSGKQKQLRFKGKTFLVFKSFSMLNQLFLFQLQLKKNK